ncbi:MAG: DUF3592 domain-containing protein [Gemmatimonadaceae bacterium]|nr:DUF3592 domain-containing protein [Gemmatimonadaceae bacterium]
MARIVTFVIFGGLGLMMLYVGISQFVQQRRNLTNAERVDATIVHSQVDVNTTKDTDTRVGSSNNNTTHTPNVRFRYLVSGQEYESDRLYPTIIGRGYASMSAAAEVLAPFPMNARVRAFVDPSHPEQAFLVEEAGSGPIVFIILGLLLPPLAWFVGKYI